LSKASNLGPHSTDKPEREGRKEKKKGKRSKAKEVQQGENDSLAPSDSAGPRRGRSGKINREDSESDSHPTGKGKKKRGSAPPAEPEGEPDLPGKAKYLPVPVVNEARSSGQGTHHISVFSHITDLKGLTIAVREPDGTVHAVEYTDAELTSLREKRELKHNWASFFKALNSAFVKGNPKVRKQQGGIVLDIILSSTKEPKHQTFPLELKKIGNSPSITTKYFFDPFQKWFVKHVDRAGEKLEIEAPFWAAESKAEDMQRETERLQMSIKKMQREKDGRGVESEEVLRKLDQVQRDVSMLLTGARRRHFLDALYETGGARPFNGHTPHALNFEPREIAPNEGACQLIPLKYPLDKENMSDQELARILSEPPSDPKLKEALDGMSDQRHWAVMRCFEKIDKWDYDVFALSEATDNGALFHTAFCLLHKYDLMSHFDLPVDKTKRFLSAAQAGYRPNPYHNSTHAADVLHVTHFVMGPGGLSKMLRVTREDMLAAVLAAAVHDYDHPGFNNNFHTRTGGYLATLYNDRSILENHHCASIFEMMNIPAFDILSHLSEDQRKDVRDAMVDMLLSTDMGNHAKIFSAFRRRLNESDDWVSRKEDVRLALVMAIKMADISNCGRPRKLYLQWAKNIATEFYAQGDAELKLGVGVSPFMDRRKDKTDFAKGQISFINFIVVPLFEAMAELLPSLEFTTKICQANKDHWAKDTEGSGAL